MHLLLALQIFFARISTFRAHIKVISREIEVLVRFPDGNVKIANFSELGSDSSSAM